MRVEFLILIIILLVTGIVVSTAFFSARVEAKDQRRLADVTQIEKALSLFFQENGFYPSSQNNTPSRINEYLDFWPQAPKADGNCSSTQNNYIYSQKAGGDDYLLTYCLGKIGPQFINSKGI
jgi:hypothetical protein